MISLLASFAILCLPMQEPAPEQVQYEMGIYEIDALIDRQAEMQSQLAQRWLLETARLATVEVASNVDSGKETVDLFTKLALAALLQAEEEALIDKGVPYLSDLPTIGTLFKEKEAFYPFTSADDLLETVRTFMSPPFDPERQGLKIEKMGSRRLLLAYLQPAQRLWLENFLAYQAEADQWQGLIRMQVILAPDKIVLGSGGDASVFSNYKEVEAATKAFEQAGADMLLAPSLMTLPGQKAVLTISNQVAYIAGWALTKVQPSGATIADPTIEVVEDGLTLSARAFQVGEGLYGIAIEVEMAQLEQPIVTRTITIQEQDFEIGIPEVTTAKISSAALLPDGAGVMLRSPDFKDGRTLVLLVSFEKIVFQEEEGVPESHK
jgi:hypothetical protein